MDQEFILDQENRIQDIRTEWRHRAAKERSRERWQEALKGGQDDDSHFTMRCDLQLSEPRFAADDQNSEYHRRQVKRQPSESDLGTSRGKGLLQQLLYQNGGLESQESTARRRNVVNQLAELQSFGPSHIQTRLAQDGPSSPCRAEIEDRVLNVRPDALKLARKETRFKREPANQNKIAVSSKVGQIEVNESKNDTSESVEEWGQRHAMALQAAESGQSSQTEQNSKVFRTRFVDRNHVDLNEGESLESNSLFHQLVSIQHDPLKDKYLDSTQEANAKFHQQLHERARALSNTRISKGTRNKETGSKESSPSHNTNSGITSKQQVMSFGQEETKAHFSGSITSFDALKHHKPSSSQNIQLSSTKMHQQNKNLVETRNIVSNCKTNKVLNMQIFAERASMRFTMKELAGILDDLNFQLSKSVMQHEKMERQETMAQIKETQKNSIQTFNDIEEQQELNALKMKKMSNFELLEHIRLESRVMKVRYQEMNESEDNVWKKCIEMKEKNQYLRSQLVDMKEDKQRLQAEIDKIGGEIDMKEDRSRKWGSSIDLNLDNDQWKTRELNNKGGQVTKFVRGLDQDSISNENVNQIVSFRYDPNQEHVSSLSARKLAQKFATGDVSEHYAVSIINKKINEKDQHVKILNEYISKLKRELTVERNKVEKSKQLNMPQTTCNRQLGSIRSSQSIESLEPSVYPSQAPTTYSGAEANQRLEVKRESAYNEYVQTSVDDESYVKTTKDLSDRTGRNENASNCCRIQVADGSDKGKFDELQNQIYYLTNQIQGLESHIKGQDPMNTSYFKNGNFLVAEGNNGSQQTAWVEEPTDSQRGSDDLLMELPHHRFKKGTNLTSSAPRESEDRDSVEDMAYMAQIVDSNLGPDKFCQQYNFNHPSSRRKSVPNTATASRAAFSGLTTPKNDYQASDSNPNRTASTSKNINTPRPNIQKKQMFIDNSTPSQDIPESTNYYTEYIQQQKLNLEQSSKVKRLITDNFNLQTAIQNLQADLDQEIQNLHADLDQEIERVEYERQQNENLTALYEQTDDELQKMRILNNEQQFFNDADKVIIQGLKRDLEHQAVKIADFAKQLTDSKEENQKVKDEKLEVLQLAQQGKNEVDKMIKAFEEEKSKMAKEAKKLKDEVNLARREATQRVAEVQTQNRVKEEEREKVYRQRIEEKEKVLEQLNTKLVSSEREFLNQKKDLQKKLEETYQQYFDQKSNNQKQIEDHKNVSSKFHRDGSIRQSELLRLQDENLTLKILIEEQIQQFRRDIEAKDEHHAQQMSYFKNQWNQIESKKSITFTEGGYSSIEQENGDFSDFLNRNKQPAKQLLAVDELLKVMAELKNVQSVIVDQSKAETLQNVLTNFDEFKLKVLDNIILWHKRTNDIALQANHYDSVLREYLSQIAQLKQLVIDKSKHVSAQNQLIKRLRALASSNVEPAVPDYLLRSIQTLQTSFQSQMRIKEGECTELIAYQDKFRDEYVLMTNQRDQLMQDKTRLQEQVIWIETERNRVIEDQRRYQKQLEEAIGFVREEETDDVDVPGVILSMRHQRVDSDVQLVQQTKKIQEGAEQIESLRNLFSAQIQSLEEKLDAKQREWIDTQELLHQEFAEQEAKYEKEIQAEKDIALSLAKDLEFQERKNEKLEQKMFAEFNRVSTLKSGIEAQQLEALQQSDSLRMLNDTHATLERQLAQTQKVLDDRLRQLDEQDRAMKEQNLQMRAVMQAKEIIAKDNLSLLNEILNLEAVIGELQGLLDAHKAQSDKQVTEIKIQQNAESKSLQQEILQLKSQLNITRAAHDQKLGEAAEKMNAENQSLRAQLNQKTTKESTLFTEIKRYQDSVSYLSRQLDDRNRQIDNQNQLSTSNQHLKAELEQQEKKYQALKRLHDCQTEKKKQITQGTTQTDKLEILPTEKLQKMEKQMYDSMNSQKDLKKENQHIRQVICRQEQEIKRLINDKRELENQVLILSARKTQENQTYHNHSQFGEAQSNLVIFEKDKYISSLESEILELRTEMGGLKEKEIELEMETLLQTKRSSKDKIAQKKRQIVSSTQYHQKEQRTEGGHRRTTSQVNKSGLQQHQKLHQHSLSTYGVETTQRDGSTIGRRYEEQK